MTIRVAMWSGPRNISTAMMRSWENRPDCSVVDEPFYAWYLAQTRSPHPMFEEVLASQSQNYHDVARQLSSAPCNSAVQYQKHMTHHMLVEDFEWARELRHCFLIRDPAQVVNSYTNSRGVCTAEDIGINRQLAIYQTLTEITGQAIPVVDSNDVLKSPESMLRQLCTELQLPFYAAMLRWPKGQRNSDGVWASHWYHAVEQSTGFSPWHHQALQLNEEQQQVVHKVSEAYNWLKHKALKPA